MLDSPVEFCSPRPSDARSSAWSDMRPGCSQDVCRQVDCPGGAQSNRTRPGWPLTAPSAPADRAPQQATSRRWGSTHAASGVAGCRPGHGPAQCVRIRHGRPVPLAQLDLANRVLETGDRPRMGGLLAAPVAFAHFQDLLCHDHKPIRGRTALRHVRAVAIHRQPSHRSWARVPLWLRRGPRRTRVGNVTRRFRARWRARYGPSRHAPVAGDS
jgi:hypothetical protein